MNGEVLRQIKNTIKSNCYYAENGDYVIPRDIVYQILHDAELDMLFNVCGNCTYFERSEDEEDFTGKCHRHDCTMSVDISCSEFEQE